MKRAALIALACLALTAGSHSPAAQQASSNGGATLFTGARLIADGDKPPIEDSAFLVDNGRITKVGRRADVRAPAGIAHVDLAGKTVIPALVNAHGHVGFQKDASFEKENYSRETIVNQLEQYAYYGVGAVMTTGTDAGDLSYELRAHPVPGAALLRTAGRGFAAPGAGPGQAAMRDAPYGITTVEEARRDVREIAAKKPDFIKLWVDDRGGTVKKLAPDLYRAVLDEAHKHHIRVMVHEFYLADSRDLVEAGADGFLHSVRDAEMDDAIVARMKQKHMFITPNLAIGGNNPPTAHPWYDDALLAEVFSPAVIARAPACRRDGRRAGIDVLRSADPQFVEIEQGGRDDRARRRHRHPEQLSRLRRAPSARADGGSGDDAAAGARRGHAHAGRASPHHRHGLARPRQTGQLRRPRREPARRSRERAEDRRRLPARSADRSHGAARPLDRRALHKPLTPRS